MAFRTSVSHIHPYFVGGRVRWCRDLDEFLIANTDNVAGVIHRDMRVLDFLSSRAAKPSDGIIGRTGRPACLAGHLCRGHKMDGVSSRSSFCIRCLYGVPDSTDRKLPRVST